MSMSLRNFAEILKMIISSFHYQPDVGGCGKFWSRVLGRHKTSRVHCRWQLISGHFQEKCPVWSNRVRGHRSSLHNGGSEVPECEELTSCNLLTCCSFEDKTESTNTEPTFCKFVRDSTPSINSPIGRIQSQSTAHCRHHSWGCCIGGKDRRGIGCWQNGGLVDLGGKCWGGVRRKGGDWSGVLWSGVCGSQRQGWRVGLN